MKPVREATITIDKYGHLVIDGKIKISEEAKLWIIKNSIKGKHICVFEGFLGIEEENQQLILASVQQIVL